jgi:plastocyanin
VTPVSRFPAALAAIGLVLAGGPARSQETPATFRVADPEGAPVEHAVIALYPDAAAPPPGPMKAVMDQRDKQFRPHVLAVRVGTVVHFPNSDQIRHHVYSFSPAKTFELKLYAGVEASPVTFDRPGKVVLGCNIHDHMLGYVYALETGHFAVTGADGAAALALPAGGYALRVLHPLLSEEIEVVARVTAPLAEPLAIRLPAPLDPVAPAAPASADPLEHLFRKHAR